MLRFDDNARTLELSVRDVVEAGPPSGHLSLGMAWSARARMAAGQAIHRSWQADQLAADPAFEKEVTVRHRMVVSDWEVVITGRMDGLSREGDHWVVEEVKSTALDAARLDRLVVDDLPEAALQLRLYLHVLAARGQQAIGRLVLISLADGTQRVIHVEADPGLGTFLQTQLGWIVGQREARNHWLGRRRNALIPMAHPTWRPGQEELAAEVEEVLERDGHLLLSAPTGLGKTAAVLHGALRVAYQTDRRIFFATARTTQQRIVEETVQRLADAGLPIHALSIRARDKVCLNEVVACRPDCCRFANGHHDKVRQHGLLEKLWEPQADRMPVPSPDDVVQVGELHEVCPFALTLDLASRADVVVGDYNYVFDPARRLAAIAAHPEEWIIVVDEAHNLPDRAMGYASPSVSLGLAQAALEGLQPHPAYVACADLAREVVDFLEGGFELMGEVSELALGLDDGLVMREVAALSSRFDALAMDYAFLRFESPVFEKDDPWLELARSLSRLRSTLERTGEETVVIWRSPKASEPAGVKLLCRDSAPLLQPLFDELSGSVVMSATLSPPDFYRGLLGLAPDRTVHSEHASPFPDENRMVLVVPQVSTEYRHRSRDREATAQLIQEVIETVPGNLAVYFSSFAFRDKIAGLLRFEDRPVLVQERHMDETDRAALLDTMTRGENHVLLGVLGGIFAEGIDLPGAGLTAAVVVGPALPQVGLERRLMSAWFQERYENGFRYAFQVPGMARVVQAAGRVIRTPVDRGAIILIGRRFLQRSYQDFFPGEWAPQRTEHPAAELDGWWDARLPRVDCGH